MRINDVKTDPRGIVMIIERKGLLTHSWNIQGVFILDRGYNSLGNAYRIYYIDSVSSTRNFYPIPLYH